MQVCLDTERWGELHRGPIRCFVTELVVTGVANSKPCDRTDSNRETGTAYEKGGRFICEENTTSLIRDELMQSTQDLASGPGVVYV